LARHRHFHVGSTVDNEIAGEADSHPLDSAGKGEAIVVVIGYDAAATIVTAGGPLGTEDSRNGVWHVDRSDQLPVDVQLAVGGWAFSGLEVRLTGGFQFVAERESPTGTSVLETTVKRVASEEVVDEVQPAVSVTSLLAPD
jgi:hypothetical protein